MSDTVQTAPLRLGLNEKHESPAYHAGRFFAVCQHIQQMSGDEVNSTYVDRFFGAASSHPASVLPRVFKLAVHRLKKIENWMLRSDLQATLWQLHHQLEAGWPAVLGVREQGNFQLGFFHQSASLPINDMRRRLPTHRGEAVKSSGEKAIADCLYAMPEDEAKHYAYEEKLPLPNYKDGTEKMEPDFTLRSTDGERTLYIEYTGLEGNSEYDSQWKWKATRYRKMGCRTAEDCMTDGRFSELTLCQLSPNDRSDMQAFERRLRALISGFLAGEADESLRSEWLGEIPTPW